MATRTRTARLARIAYAAMKDGKSSSSSSLHHSQPHLPNPVPPELASAATIGSRCISSLASSPVGIVNGASCNISTLKCLNGVESGFRQLTRSTRSYVSSTSPSQITPSDFTEMAWEGIVGAVDAARGSNQQVVESDHLMKALLEQKDGLARRIFTKASIDNTSILQATNDFISQQPKAHDTSSPVIGSHLNSLLENAKKYKKEFGDDFLSVEHLLLAFHSDKRFGQQLFRNLQLGEKELKDAVKAVRGNQRVTDQSVNPPLFMFLML